MSRAGLQAYLRDSRDLFTSMILVLPLFVAYQIGVLMTGGVRNGVDFLTDVLLFAVDRDLTAYVGINLFVLLLFGGALFLLRKRGTFSPGLIPWMMLESAVYALLFGGVVILMMESLGLGVLLAAGEKGDRSVLDALVLSIGAGLYEELVFRLVLMGGIYWVLHRVLHRGRWTAALVALVVSSAVFSFVHHLGPLGEPFTLGVFLYRFFAGVLLATIYQARGFAIAVYTHALYDVYVMVLRGD